MVLTRVWRNLSVRMCGCWWVVDGAYHWYCYSVLSLCPWPAAGTQIKKNTDSTDFTRIGLSRIFFWCYLANDSWILVWIEPDLQVLGHFLFSICFAMHNCYRVFPSDNIHQPPLVLKSILTFPKGRNKYSANEHQPPLVLKPILTFPKGRNKLHLPMNISPLSFSPEGEMPVTLVIDKS